jgi:hypothetical protein
MRWKRMSTPSAGMPMPRCVHVNLMAAAWVRRSPDRLPLQFRSGGGTPPVLTRGTRVPRTWHWLPANGVFTGFQPVHALEAHGYAIGKDADATCGAAKLRRPRFPGVPFSWLVWLVSCAASHCLLRTART